MIAEMSLENCFNPRSRAGSDTVSRISAPPRICFNPRSRAGSDFLHLQSGYLQWVSIHAPVRGATGEKVMVRAFYESFNPRSRAGSDPASRCAGTATKEFQSTLPCGERHGATGAVVSADQFQSTLPCGERLPWP